jgi:hypothetical protein
VHCLNVNKYKFGFVVFHYHHATVVLCLAYHLGKILIGFRHGYHLITVNKHIYPFVGVYVGIFLICGAAVRSEIVCCIFRKQNTRHVKKTLLRRCSNKFFAAAALFALRSATSNCRLPGLLPFPHTNCTTNIG